MPGNPLQGFLVALSAFVWVSSDFCSICVSPTKESVSLESIARRRFGDSNWIGGNLQLDRGGNSQDQSPKHKNEHDAFRRSRLNTNKMFVHASSTFLISERPRPTPQKYHPSKTISFSPTFPAFTSHLQNQTSNKRTKTSRGNATRDVRGRRYAQTVFVSLSLTRRGQVRLDFSRSEKVAFLIVLPTVCTQSVGKKEGKKLKP